MVIMLIWKISRGSATQLLNPRAYWRQSSQTSVWFEPVSATYYSVLEQITQVSVSLFVKYYHFNQLLFYPYKIVHIKHLAWHMVNISININAVHSGVDGGSNNVSSTGKLCGILILERSQTTDQKNTMCL